MSKSLCFLFLLSLCSFSGVFLDVSANGLVSSTSKFVNHFLICSKTGTICRVIVVNNSWRSHISAACVIVTEYQSCIYNVLFHRCVLLSLCPSIAVSFYRCVLLSLCPSIAVSFYHCVLLSLCPSIAVSYRCVLLSLCPSIAVSFYHCVLLSLCPSIAGL